jgi:bla regulator protein BlaR1
MMDALFNSLWQGAFVVAIAALINMVVPGRHAATRYALWFVALLTLALLPLIGQFSPRLPSPVIPSAVVHTTSAVSQVALETSGAGGLWVAIVWAAGILVCTARIAMSYLWLSRVRSFAAPAPQLGRGVFTSGAIASPIAAGLWHPVIIVPDDLVRTLAPHDLDAILAHERAHIARNDVFSNVIQRVVESLLFFNPWVYVIGHQLVRERESACDDWAVRAGSDPNRYAACLARLGLRNLQVQTSLVTPSASWPKGMLVGRIARLLDGKAIQVRTNYAIVATAIALFAVLGFVLQNGVGLAAAGCSSDVAVLQPAALRIPESIVKAHPNAAVTLAVTVTAGGHASDIRLVKSSGNQAIDFAAAHAARDTKYKTEFRNCHAVSGGRYTFTVEPRP